MSFVSVLARENFLTVVSDGRVQGPDLLPMQEDYRKFIQVDSGFFVAFAGHKEPCERFIDKSGLSRTSSRDLGLVSQRTKNLLLTHPYKNSKILLAFGGLNTLGEIEFATFSTLEPEIRFFQPRGDDLSYAFLNNSSLKTTNLAGRLEKYLLLAGIGKGIESPDQLINAQVMLNNFVANLDSSVNTTTFTLSIQK